MICFFNCKRGVNTTYKTANGNHPTKLIASGDINPVTEELSAYVIWLNDTFLPIFMQALMEILMIAISLIAWRAMKMPLPSMGLTSLRQNGKDGFVGLVLGAGCCSFVFIVLLLSGNAEVVSWGPKFDWEMFCWIMVYVMVGFGEEILSRGFLMSTLRQSRCRTLIIFFPAVFFSLIHLFNDNVSVLSLLNIFLVGLLFAYIYWKSGNIWMCIGYHIAWNIFQGIVFGMPISGINTEGIINTMFAEDNFINGGGFGIEGGILTTLVIGIAFIIVRQYYLHSKYDFMCSSSETRRPEQEHAEK